jgi:putative membrane protein
MSEVNVQPYRIRRWSAPASLMLLCLLQQSAYAHVITVSQGPRNLPELARAWTFDPGVVVALAISLALYLRGAARLWKACPVGRGLRMIEFWSFLAGWLTLVVALVSPLHAWGNALFSAHMVQHELLMLVAAPLLILGKPLAICLSALPRGWAAGLARMSRTGWCRTLLHLGSNAAIAWLIHAIVLWAWHLPAFFQATLTSNFVHALQHISFLGSALLFWWAVIYGRDRAAGYGIAVLYLFTTAMHTGLLGALLSLAGSPWYPIYAGTTEAWGLTLLEDQQLGGLIMWIPAGIVYIVAGLVLFAAWLRESEKRAVRRRASGAPAVSSGIL